MKFLVKPILIGIVIWNFLTPLPVFSHDTSEALGKYFFFKTCEIVKNDMKIHLEWLDSLLKKYDKLVQTSTTTEMLLRVDRVGDRVAFTNRVLSVSVDAFIDRKLDFILLDEKLNSLHNLAIDLLREALALLNTFEGKVDQDDSYKYNTMLLHQAREKMARGIETLDHILVQKK